MPDEASILAGRIAMRLRSLCFAAALLFSLAGCGRVHKLYYLRGAFNDPAMAKGLPLNQAYVAPNAAQMKGKTLTVLVEDPAGTINQETSKLDPQFNPKIWKQWRESYEEFLADQMWQSNVFADVSAASDYGSIKNPDLTLKFALTEWHEGNKWLRKIVGWGAGATRVQFEGAVVETKANRVLFAFADARIHPGGSWTLGLFSLKIFNGPALIKQDLHWAAEDLRKAARKVSGTTEPIRKGEWRPFTRPQQPAAGSQAPPAVPNIQQE